MKCRQLRIVYAGTPDFSVAALAALIAAGHDVIAAYTQPDRPAGRGRKLSASPVKLFAVENNIPVYQPKSFRKQQVRAELAELHPDVMVVAAYGLILPPEVLQIPALGCVNIHASVLPRWRGAAPIQRAIQAGDTHSGVSIMQMDEGLDTGAVLQGFQIPIPATMNAEGLHDALAKLGASAIVEVLPKLCNRELSATPQDNSQATYADKIHKQEAVIDWSLDAVSILNQIRAFNPFPVAYTWLGNKTLRIWQAEPAGLDTASAVPGTLLLQPQGQLLVATGSTAIRLETVQLQGKKALPAADFMNGRQLQGVVLGEPG